jgi:hypothetical protein
MKPELQIEALAKLDGWTDIQPDIGGGRVGTPPDWSGIRYQPLPPYLASRDAIIPMIEKHIQSEGASSFASPLFVALNISNYKKLHPDILIGCAVSATPAQLCEALLRALNLWTD